MAKTPDAKPHLSLTSIVHEALVSRHILSTRAILLYAATSPLLIVTAEYIRNGQSSIWAAVAFSLYSAMISATLAVATRWLVRLAWGTHPRARITVLWLLSVGATRGAIMGVIVTETGAATEPHFVERILGGATSLPLILGIIAVVVGGVLDHRERVAELTQTVSRLIDRRAQTLKILTAFRSDLAERTSTAIMPALSRISRLLDPQTDLTRGTVIGELSNLVDTVVRPLSHDLAANKPEDLPPAIHNSQIPKPEWGRTSAFDALQPLWSGIIVVGVAASGVVEFFGAFRGFTMAMLYAGVLIAVLAAFRHVFRRYSFRPLTLIVLASLAHELGGVAYVYTLWALGFPIFDYPLSIAGIIVATPIVGGSIAAYVILALRRELIEQELRDSNLELGHIVSGYRRTAWLEQRRRAHHLHSTVQSRLHAEARFLSSRTGILNDRELERLHETIDSISDSASVAPAYGIDPLRELDKLRDFWAGICEIRLDISDEVRDALHNNGAPAEAVQLVTTEAITNAIRHGSATQIEVEMRLSNPEVVSVAVTNNGGNVTTEERSGLGMTTYDELTMQWDLSTMSDMTTFTASISTRNTVIELPAMY
ncbi:MAG: hypothetical protein RL431_915 [Actinomycetota bacterium]|jgi:signal transduction histidine kinase